MKATPRKAEREIALVFSQFFSDIGMSPVERIPILGRTGPDITINEAKLVIDVKSRKSVPVKMTAIQGCLHQTDNVSFFQLSDMQILDQLKIVPASFSSITTVSWLNHMQEWTKEECPEGISMIVMRKPGTPYPKSTVIIYSSDLRRLQCQMQYKS
ncbi:MAG: hypothetical protein ABIJ65_12800 [Chloroflexota bacterium]